MGAFFALGLVHDLASYWRNAHFILPELRLTVIVWALSAGRDTRSSVLLKGNILEALGRNEDARAWKSRADSMPQRNWSESLTLR